MEPMEESAARQWSMAIAHGVQHTVRAILVLPLKCPADGISSWHVVCSEKPVSADNRRAAQREHNLGDARAAAAVEVVVKPLASVGCKKISDGCSRCIVLLRLILNQASGILVAWAVAAGICDRTDRKQDTTEVEQGDGTQLDAIVRPRAYACEPEAVHAVRWR